MDGVIYAAEGEIFRGHVKQDKIKQETSPAPVHFRNSPNCRAVGALKVIYLLAQAAVTTGATASNGKTQAQGDSGPAAAGTAADKGAAGATGKADKP